MKKILATILSACMILALLTSCGSEGASSASTGTAGTTSSATSSSSDATPAEGTSSGDTTLTVGVMDDTDGFDPINTVNYVGCNLVYETLVDIDPETSEAYGVLAESWEYVDDTHLKVKLYDDATFSNGDSVTGQDVYYSWYRNITENSSDMNCFAFIDWDNWEFVSDKEFIISFLEPFGPAVNYMTMCAFSVMSESAMENATSDDFWSSPVGSGPYTVVENVSGSYSSYQRNDNYWNTEKMPDASFITVKNYSDASTMFIDFETGGLDIAFDLDSTDADRVSAGSVDGAVLETISTNNIIGLALPEYTESLDDVRVREALAYALDVEALTEIAYGSLATTSTSLVPANVQNVLDVGIQEYNPEKAKELLAEAGVSGLTLNLVIVGSDTNERLATTMQSYFNAIGVTLNIDSCDLATAISHFKNSETDIVINSGSVVTMDTYEALQMTLATSTNATIRITDEDYNNDLLTGKSASDDAARAAAYTEAQQWLADNYRQIPICEPSYAYCFYSDKVTSVNTMCDEALTLRYVELS
jgi:peptide/nickel transport system substrate-binding protein